MRKILLLASFSLFGLLIANPLTWAKPASTLPQTGQQSQQETKSVSGTVSSIGNQGHSFSLDVNQGTEKVTLQFVVDQETHVQGQVKVGTAVTVEYVAMAQQNVAKTVTAQG
jgi:hypothetical protein